MDILIEEVIPEESETEEEQEEATEDSEASHAETTDEDTMSSSEKEGEVLFVMEGTSSDFISQRLF